MDFIYKAVELLSQTVKIFRLCSYFSFVTEIILYHSFTYQVNRLARYHVEILKTQISTALEQIRNYILHDL